MMRVPFGEEVSTQRIVDVTEVPNGDACGCICLSCRQPLIARQGDILEWHFAHHVAKDAPQVACDYSFEMSVRLMIREVARSPFAFHTPPGFALRLDGEPLKLVKPRVVTVQNTKIGSQFVGEEVDVVGEVDGVPLIVFVAYPGRTVPSAISTPDVERCGVLVMDLGAACDEQERAMLTTRDGVRRFLADRATCREWVYHPSVQLKGLPLISSNQAEMYRRQPAGGRDSLPEFARRLHAEIEGRNQSSTYRGLQRPSKRQIDRLSPPTQLFECVDCGDRRRYRFAVQCNKCFSTREPRRVLLTDE